MNNWILISSIAPIFFAFGNIIDAYIVQKSYDLPGDGIGGYALLSSLVALIIIPIFLILGYSKLFLFSNVTLSLILLGGALDGLGTLLYLYALEYDNVTSIAAWFNTTILFNLVLGWIFLGETFSTIQLIGFVIGIVGFFLMSIESFDKKSLTFNKKAMLLMLASSFLWSLKIVLFKDVFEERSLFFASQFWSYSGLALFGIVMWFLKKTYRIAFIHILKAMSSSVTFLSLNIANEATFSLAMTLSRYAVLLAPVALVGLVEGIVQPISVLFLSIFIVALFPNQREILKIPTKIHVFVGILLTFVCLFFVL